MKPALRASLRLLPLLALPPAALPGGAAAAEVALLRPPAPGPPLALSAPGGARTAAIGLDTLEALAVGDEVRLEPLPGRTVRYALESRSVFVNGDVGWRGVRRDRGAVHHLVLVHNRRSVLASLGTPWGAFEIGGNRADGPEYIVRLSAPAAPPLAGLADDIMPPRRGPETLAHFSDDFTVVPSPSETDAFPGGTVDIAVRVVNNLAVPLADGELRVDGIFPFAEAAAGLGHCDAVGRGALFCPLPVIGPGAATTVRYSVRILERPEWPRLSISHFAFRGIRGASRSHSESETVTINLRDDPAADPAAPPRADHPVLSDADYPALVDSDGDGLSDFNEGIIGTDPGDPLSAVPPDAATEIDLAFLYTPWFADRDDASPETRLNWMTGLVNAYYAGSGARIVFRPVGHFLVDHGTEGGAFGVRDASERISNALYGEGEGAFRDVPAKVDAVGADIVVMVGGPLDIRGEDGACGVGSLSGRGNDGGLPPVERPVSVVQAECGPWTLAHELGHNLGLGHSRRDANSRAGTFQWARGHGVEGRFRTIMAAGGGWSTLSLLPLFSNPESLACGGMPCGAPRHDWRRGADAVSALNHMRFQIAAVREAAVPSGRLAVPLADAAALRRGWRLRVVGDIRPGVGMHGGATLSADPYIRPHAFVPGDSVDLRVTLEVPSRHQGETGELYIVLAPQFYRDGGGRVHEPPGVYFLDREGRWRHRPAADPDSLESVIAPRPLRAVEELTAFDGFVLDELNADIADLVADVYFAYAVPSRGVLVYTQPGIQLRFFTPDPALFGAGAGG